MFLWHTGGRIDEMMTLEKIDLVKRKRKGYFKDCKHDSDGWFFLTPKFSNKLWEFIEKDKTHSRYVFHKEHNGREHLCKAAV